MCAFKSEVIHTSVAHSLQYDPRTLHFKQIGCTYTASPPPPIILKLNSSPPIVPTPVLCSVLKYFKMKCGGSRGSRQMRCTNCKMLIEKTNREALTPKIVNFMDTVYLYTNTCRISGHFEPKKYVAFVF